MESNEVLRQIEERKSVRAYTGKAIGAAERDAILQAAFQAPTAGNQQLYTILDITDKALRHTLAELCDHQPFIEEAALCLVFLADGRRWRQAYLSAGCDAREAGSGDLLLAIADSCIAAQNTVIAAESLGIGSCYIGDVLENCEKMREALHLPKDVVPAAMLVYGYPTEEQKKRQKPRRFRAEAVVAENTYRDRTEEELREDFTLRANEERYDFDSSLRAFCARKYESGFSKEMSRSVDVYLEAFRH